MYFLVRKRLNICNDTISVSSTQDCLVDLFWHLFPRCYTAVKWRESVRYHQTWRPRYTELWGDGIHCTLYRERKAGSSQSITTICGLSARHVQLSLGGWSGLTLWRSHVLHWTSSSSLRASRWHCHPHSILCLLPSPISASRSRSVHTKGLHMLLFLQSWVYITWPLYGRSVQGHQLMFAA